MSQVQREVRQHSSQRGGKKEGRADASIHPHHETAPPGRGWLGVHVQDLTPELRQAFQIPASIQGVLVADVVPDNPAYHAGIAQGDLIVGFRGEAVLDKNTFPHQVQAAAPGTKAEVIIFRHGTQHTVQVTMGRVPDDGQETISRLRPEEVEALLGMTEDEVHALVDALDAASRRHDAEEIIAYFAPDATVDMTLVTPFGNLTPLGNQTMRFTRDQFYRHLKEGAASGGLFEVLDSHRVRLQIRISTDGQRATVAGETLETATAMGMLKIRIRTEETFQVERVRGTLAITAMKTISHPEGFEGLDVLR